MSKTIYQTEIKIYHGQYGNPTVDVTRRNNETLTYFDRQYQPTQASLTRLQKVSVHWINKGKANIGMNGRLTSIEPTD